jgi:hypothetical protein
LVAARVSVVSLLKVDGIMELSLHSAEGFEVEEDERFAFRHRPVDLAHLSRYTMGNTVLESEVLELFRRQMRLYYEKLRGAQDAEAWREAASVMKASARGVGAWQILLTAETAEKLAVLPATEARDELLATLQTQIEEADGFIRSVL